MNQSGSLLIARPIIARSIPRFSLRTETTRIWLKRAATWKTTGLYRFYLPLVADFLGRILARSHAARTIADYRYSALRDGFLLGYVAFALTELWLYGGFWPTIFVGFPLHAPVTAFYTALLMLLRRRWPEFVTRAALLGCGVGMGFFPALGAFPVYFFR